MPSSSTPASIAPESSSHAAFPSLADTCARMLREQVPNFLRVDLNPYVVQTCYCLNRLVQSVWPSTGPSPWQSFLANSCDEALSGAIKLARFACNRDGRSPSGLLLDAAGRLGYFAAIPLEGGGRIECIPDLTVVTDPANRGVLGPADRPCGFLALLGTPQQVGPAGMKALDALLDQSSVLLITVVSRTDLADWRQASSAHGIGWKPDIVVFDESFVNREVPFAAFSAPRRHFAAWNRLKRGTFHSTTYQPNTISTLHFLRCLEHNDPAFFATVAPELERIQQDPKHCLAVLETLYSPVLARMIRRLGLVTRERRAMGHYVQVAGQRIFDGVAGIACSIRGHNPPSYAAEISDCSPSDINHKALAARLAKLTGLEHLVPAVSGASAVETGLRLALAAQYPRRVVLAFRGGFGGKTLLALTGTADASYKTHLDPLYADVVYLDPFAPDARERLKATLRQHEVAVVQLELIQGVGGVRPFPADLLHDLDRHRPQQGYFLFVDEVQTGMYRTGSFVRSRALGITPDILTLGKGTSDMMFPFGLTLYSAGVAARLARQRPDLPQAIWDRHGYAIGLQTVANTLARAEADNLAARVQEAGAWFTRQLADRLADCPSVRAVRVYGLLIGIELETTGWPRQWLGKRLTPLYLLGMLRHPAFPLLVGYCQYEPHVLKLTPPLSITPEEIQQVCATIADVLRRPLSRLLSAALRSQWSAWLRRGLPLSGGVS